MESVKVIRAFADGTIRLDTQGRLGPVVRGQHPDDFCYLCEQIGADSDEHIISRAFYRVSRSDNEGPRLLAHKACNSAYSADEEYVRNRLVALAEAYGMTHDGAIKAAGSALGLDSAKTGEYTEHVGGKLRGLWREIRKNDLHYLWDPSLACKDRLYRVFEKIVRGVAYWLTAKLPPRPSEAAWDLHLPHEGSPLAGEQHRIIIRDGFEARAKFEGDGTQLTHGELHLTFYGGVHIRVAFQAVAGTKIVP
jgi:hypothetical protein